MASQTSCCFFLFFLFLNFILFFFYVQYTAPPHTGRVKLSVLLLLCLHLLTLILVIIFKDIVISADYMFLYWCKDFIGIENSLDYLGTLNSYKSVD